MESFDDFGFEFFLDKMAVYLDVFVYFMEGRIMCEVDNKVIVTIDGCGFVKLNSKVFKEILKPLDLTCEASERWILDFKT